MEIIPDIPIYCTIPYIRQKGGNIQMRSTRVEKFRNLRREQIKKFLIYGMFLPCTSILIGYIITILFILPGMTSVPK